MLNVSWGPGTYKILPVSLWRNRRLRIFLTMTFLTMTLTWGLQWGSSNNKGNVQNIVNELSSPDVSLDPEALFPLHLELTYLKSQEAHLYHVNINTCSTWLTKWTVILIQRIHLIQASNLTKIKFSSLGAHLSLMALIFVGTITVLVRHLLIIKVLKWHSVNKLLILILVVPTYHKWHSFCRDTYYYSRAFIVVYVLKWQPVEKYLNLFSLGAHLL